MDLRFVSKQDRKVSINQISQIDLGWLAGILEGEGNFDLRLHKNDKGGQLQIRVGMTDKDIIDRLLEVTGVGHLSEQQRKNGWKVMYYWKVSDMLNCVALIEIVLPILGERRRSEALHLVNFALERFEDQKSCKHGHLWTEESTGFCKTGRYCLICSRETGRRRSAEKSLLRATTKMKKLSLEM